MPEPAQIFMSYSWKDNTIPPSDPSAEAGFVSALAEQIHYEFDTSDSKPALWWDRDKIDEAQQFDPLIEEAINRSSLFLIVLSNHWIDSEYCRLELELFRKRWSHLDDYQFQHRVILAHKMSVAEDRRPKLLPRQRGFQFFSLAADGSENHFHRRGRGDKRFFSMAGDLGQVLVKHANYRGGPQGPIVPETAPAPAPDKPANPDAHTVYLAKPAGDMRDEYHRLHEELSAHGYNVIPPLDSDIPDNAEATRYVDEALRDAVVSVHLVGKGKGSTPDGLDEPIVKLQLTQAQKKISALPQQGSVDPSRFHRIIWAPAIVRTDEKLVSRSPIEAFNSVGQHQPGDQIEGESLNPFLVSLKQHLRSIPRKSTGPASKIDLGEKIYLCHDEADSLYAAEWLNVLNDGKYNCETPAYFGTSDRERAKHHQEQLAQCSAVVVCWAGASELWAKTQSRELANWEALGRTGEFRARGLIAGPPPHIRKDDRVLRGLFPPREIDVVVNMTQSGTPSLEAIRGLFEPGANTAP